MAFLDRKDLKPLYQQSKMEAHLWREDYPNYERLAENGLMEGLDVNLPEVNDGSLSAALFKLPKRIVSSELSGTVKALDRDEAWMTELANIVWEKDIIPNANTQAPFIRKWKDAVRKAAIYGSVPLITLFVDNGGKRHADFIVAQPQDVTLLPGKVSDYDSKVKFWDIYLDKTDFESLIEQAKEEQKQAKENKEDGYNKWDIPAMEEILKNDQQQERSSQDTPRQELDKDVRPKGFKFCVAVQEGVDAPFYMYHSSTDKAIREWSNPDPTGDTIIHFLYCYQDFINPYGIGIVKLAGGTQNVLDYMRQADVLATQLGLEPPLDIQGDADSVDLDSLVYANRAMWFTGNAKVVPVQIGNDIYSQLPNRISMYKTSLNQLIPTGDTSISTDAGDPQYSKTPAGVKFQAAALSIDDEDFKDNLYITYAAVAKSMINTHFANMEGSDLLKLSDDERDRLMKAGMEFPQGEDGTYSNELEIVWDTARATFDFEVDPETDKAQDDADKLEGLMKVAELVSNPQTLQFLASGQPIILGNRELNPGELFSEIIQLTSDNDKILTEVTPEEEAERAGVDPETGLPMEQPTELPQEVAGESEMTQPQEPTDDMDGEQRANVNAIMEQYGVDEITALTALAAEAQGLPTEDIIAHMQEEQGVRS